MKAYKIDKILLTHNIYITKKKYICFQLAQIIQINFLQLNNFFVGFFGRVELNTMLIENREIKFVEKDFFF